MMTKVLPLTALALSLSTGAAFADRGRGEHHGSYAPRAAYVSHDRGFHGGGNVVVRDRGFRGGNVVVRDHGFRGGNVVVRDRGFRGGNVVVRDGGFRHFDRRPIFVSRPVIGHRYFNYYQRPAVIFENFAPMPGYYWVYGQWTWNGYEWIWQPGHYEPDPYYADPGYGY